MHGLQVVMNRNWITAFGLFVLVVCLYAPHAAGQTKQPPAKKTTKAQPGTKKTPATTPAAKRPAGAGVQPTGAQAEFEELLKLPAAERITRLQAFIETNPPAALKTRAVEHLVSAHAALADERLQAGDAAGGVEEFKQAVALAPADMSDGLYTAVVSQFPANLFLRGQTDAAFEVARLIE